MGHVGPLEEFKPPKCLGVCLEEALMGNKDGSTQHFANGVGGSNDPASKPGQDKHGKPIDQSSRKRSEGSREREVDQKGQRHLKDGGQL